MPLVRVQSFRWSNVHYINIIRTTRIIHIEPQFKGWMEISRNVFVQNILGVVRIWPIMKTRSPYKWCVQFFGYPQFGRDSANNRARKKNRACARKFTRPKVAINRPRDFRVVGCVCVCVCVLLLSIHCSFGVWTWERSMFVCIYNQVSLLHLRIASYQLFICVSWNTQLTWDVSFFPVLFSWTR